MLDDHRDDDGEQGEAGQDDDGPLLVVPVDLGAGPGPHVSAAVPGDGHRLPHLEVLLGLLSGVVSLLLLLQG